MPTPEKKFFSYGNRSYTLVMGKRWYVEYYTSAGADVLVRNRLYGQINRIKDLTARAAAAEALINQLETELPQPDISVLENILEEIRPTLRYKSYMTYRSKVRGWRTYLKNVPDQAATPDQAKAYIAGFTGKRSNACVKSYRDTLHSLYLRARLNSPFAEVKTAPKSSKSMKTFSDAQAAAILAMAGRKCPPLVLAIKLLFYCFIRPGEARMLRVEDIDLDGGSIELRSEISKNKKTQQVCIPTAFKSDLSAALAGRTSGLLFTRRDRMISHSFFYKQHLRILKSLDIKGRYSLYSWKHTGAVKTVKAGIRLKDLQLQLRHHSLDQVNQYLQDLGVMDCNELRDKFPNIG